MPSQLNARSMHAADVACHGSMCFAKSVADVHSNYCGASVIILYYPGGLPHSNTVRFCTAKVALPGCNLELGQAIFLQIPSSSEV